MPSADELWREIQAFAPPTCCPSCQPGEPTLDEHGYFCAKCGDEIPNGMEFDDAVAAYHAARAA